ncbi:substrate-binding domain-containing protein [Methylobacterium nodulans]|uniref:Transcriptional regulator of molybdate metabolism, LysR family n=1 Tax=Methylobacterium nodulans (strain LMG 21967 / CNCM I-2342 / ORS 2060) TaxID=460265 RepID=B8IM55_METNO|nr:substrate-binding domain-containing protein [Methylobacterium nodulans]ACL56399.1 transcriptional regulator of molybdate metabolism, LysR family [Methylobacterium nodulans ORS 2060]
MNDAADETAIEVALALGGTIRLGDRLMAVADAAALLDAIARSGSVQGLAAALGLSYRAAWDRLRLLEAAFGRPLVQKTRGHGSALTPAGLALRAALGAAAAGLEPALAREARALEARLRDLVGAAARPLRIAASHDPLLMELVQEMQAGEVAIMGSEEAVAQLADGRVDAAGFHCGPLAPAEAGPPFADLAADPGIALRPLFAREQGLLLAAGNPLGIRTVTDLAARGVRIVNRQKGSGTRRWFDRLLAEHGIPATSLRGYGIEEFTHQAVAAVIASGAADAGLGARAAAERFGLAFLSMGWELYYLAASASLQAGPLDRLAAQAAARAAATPGYRPPD